MKIKYAANFSTYCHIFLRFRDVICIVPKQEKENTPSVSFHLAYRVNMCDV